MNDRDAMVLTGLPKRMPFKFVRFACHRGPIPLASIEKK